jgi:hypothetical protein
VSLTKKYKYLYLKEKWEHESTRLNFDLNVYNFDIDNQEKKVFRQLNRLEKLNNKHNYEERK